MSTFPGHIYDADGCSVDGTAPDLTQEKLDGFQYRSMVCREGVAPVGLAWALQDDATWEAIPQTIKDGAASLLFAGQGILLLTNRREVENEIRAGLLDALDLALIDSVEMPRA